MPVKMLLDMDLAYPPSGPTDPFFSSVVLLMGFEGADAAIGAPGMTDESSAAHGTATIRGTAQIDTAQFKFGTSSLLLDGGGSITFPDSNDWNLGSGLFTIELWIRFTDIGNGLQSIIAQLETPSQRAWQFLANTIIAEVVWVVSTTGAANISDIHGSHTPLNNVWYHYAVDYDGIKYRMYADGAFTGSSSTARAIFDATSVLAIGADSNNNAKLKGWVDEVRITKGVARYATDGSFTPPTAAFPRS